jgi:hypothetical protein
MLLLFSLRNSASDALLRFGELPKVVIRVGDSVYIGQVNASDRQKLRRLMIRPWAELGGLLQARREVKGESHPLFCVRTVRIA